MELKYVVPTLNEDRMEHHRVQVGEVEAYLTGLRQGGAIRAYDRSFGGKGAQVFHVSIELSDESKRDLIDTTFRKTYKATPEIMIGPTLNDRIRAYLGDRAGSERRYQADQRQLSGIKGDFVTALADMFNAPEVIKLLEVTGREISIFAHYQSSMGAAMTRSGPDYEIVVSREGLIERSQSHVERTVPLPADYAVWEDIIPYGGLFHDSSSGDYTFEPDKDRFLKVMEDALTALMK